MRNLLNMGNRTSLRVIECVCGEHQLYTRRLDSRLDETSVPRWPSGSRTCTPQGALPSIAAEACGVGSLRAGGLEKCVVFHKGNALIVCKQGASIASMSSREGRPSRAQTKRGRCVVKVTSRIRSTFALSCFFSISHGSVENLSLIPSTLMCTLIYRRSCVSLSLSFFRPVPFFFCFSERPYGQGGLCIEDGSALSFQRNVTLFCSVQATNKQKIQKPEMSPSRSPHEAIEWLTCRRRRLLPLS